MKKFIVCVLILLGACKSGQRHGSGDKHIDNFKWQVGVSSDDRIIAGKLFGQFLYLDNNSELRNKVYRDPASLALGKKIAGQYHEAFSKCRTAICLAESLKISKEDSLAMVGIAARVIDNNTDAGTGKTDSAVQRIQQRVWGSNASVSVAAINHIFNIYLAGNAPLYPKIDGSSFAAGDPEFFKKVHEYLGELLDDPVSTGVFFRLPVQLSVRLLALNGRNESARYEPLIGGSNKEAYQLAKSLHEDASLWNKYQFSAILVPGLGPSSPEIALDAGGARRCDLAASKFKTGLAPFIIVSGGHVHPNKTKYSEAIEMKKYLVSRHKIPAENIIAEPFARHTTTNVRNASRLIYLFGLDPGKPILVVTDLFQATYIQMMKDRFMKEIGFLPYRSMSNKNGQLSFYPEPAALQINPFDPLDP